MSYSEDLFEKSLNLVLKDGIPYVRNYRPDFLKNNATGFNLEYDFYIPSVNAAFEIQGIHHYDDVRQKKRDKLKRILSINNGVILMEIGTLQISPSKAYSVLVGNGFVKITKKFNRDWTVGDIAKEIKKYREHILETFGRNPSNISPKNYMEAVRNKMAAKQLIERKHLTIDGDTCIILEVQDRRHIRLFNTATGREITRGFSWEQLRTLGI